MNKIERLTTEQEQEMADFREKWLSVGLSTERADKATAERVLGGFYARIGEKPPQFWHCDSPMQAQLIMNLLGGNLGDSLRDNMRRNLAENMWGKLSASLRRKLERTLERNLEENLEETLGDNLEENLERNLRDNLEHSLSADLSADLWEDLRYNLEETLEENLEDNLRDKLSASLVASLSTNLERNLEHNLEKNLMENLWDKPGHNLGHSLMENMGDNLERNLVDNMRRNLEIKLSANLWENLRRSLEENLEENLGHNLDASLRDNWRYNLKRTLWDSMARNMWENLRYKLERSMRHSLLYNLKRNMVDNLRYNLEENLSHDMRYNLVENLGDNLKHHTAYIWGAWDSPWIAFYLFPHRHIRTLYQDEDAALLAEWENLAKSCLWVYPFKGVCFVCDRPSKIKKDDEGRLHCEDGPALEFIDTYAVYAWHGTNIPASWIESPESLTPSVALTHKNIEQRRAACEILGWSKILNQLGAKTINKNDNPQIGELVEVDLPDSGRERFLRVMCGTGREFAIPVPPEMTTAAQANAWSYGLDVINPEVRT